jgi:hypothetical protein
MQLQDLLLTKAEIPITHETLFLVPIHPRLLDPDIQLDPGLASQVFPTAAEEWHADLTEHTRGLEPGQTRTWYEEVFLAPGYEISERFGRRVVGLKGIWSCQVVNRDNGFAYGLSISRNAGGSLDIPHDGPRYIYPPRVNFSDEKFAAYDAKTVDTSDRAGVMAHIYDHHNIDYRPGALFMRNWALLYLNAAMTAAGDKLFKPRKPAPSD